MATVNGSVNYEDSTPIPKQQEYTPSNIKPIAIELSKFIRTKMYGTDVRESLARWIEIMLAVQTYINDDETAFKVDIQNQQDSVEDRQTQVEGTMSDVVDQFKAVISNVTKDSEVALARDSLRFGDYAVLDDRLEYIESWLAAHVPAGFHVSLKHNQNRKPKVSVHYYEYAIGTEPHGFGTGPYGLGETSTQTISCTVDYLDDDTAVINLPLAYALTGIVTYKDGYWYLIDGYKTLRFDLGDGIDDAKATAGNGSNETSSNANGGGYAGDLGLSSYQIAVKNGFTGNISQWLASLVGPKGEKGDSAVSGTFANLAALQSTYPTGKTGIFVAADNGHKYIWSNDNWQDAGIYQAVGIADKTVTPEKTTFIDNRLDFEIEIGSITNGINTVIRPDRLRTKYMIKNPHGITIVRKNGNLLYGVNKYVDGVWDGVDSGWINANETYIEPGKDVRFNIKKADNSAFTADEIANIHNDFEVRFSFRSADYYDLEDVKDNLLVNNNVTHEQFEYGTITGNIPVDTMATKRARSKEFMQVNKNDKIMFNKDRTIFKYGVSVSNLDGAWNGIDYGWMNNEEFTVPHDSIVKLIISYVDNRTIIESDFKAVTDNAFTIATTLKSKVETNTRLLTTQEESTEKKEAINSISVEYGRLSGASYVFVRIPKTTNTGKRLLPKLALTSSDGSLSGTKRSALRYAKDTDPIFAVNAGLFNVSTVEPVGQLIIDGVSLINTPMTSDNGVPINPNECYPLAIDANGDLTTYPRNADTADMIANGVKYAVTAWGKLVDNFEIATTDIENEIVHSGRYIRQSIGQYQNGDYCVCTVDMTRGAITNEAGLYYKELAQIFVDKGVKFAYSLDGGGSAETVLGKRQLNPIYEGSEGRAVPTVITFEII